MTIRKDYHFYAAHRNEMLQNKCRNLHGHTYYVVVGIQGLIADEDSGISLLFEDIDAFVEPIIKSLDHATLIHKADKLLPYLMAYSAEQDDPIKIVRFDYPTSVENIIFYLREKILDAMKKLKITDTNLIVSVKETFSSLITL